MSLAGPEGARYFRQNPVASDVIVPGLPEQPQSAADEPGHAAAAAIGRTAMTDVRSIYALSRMCGPRLPAGAFTWGKTAGPSPPYQPSRAAVSGITTGPQAAVYCAGFS